jgi:DHA1 family bicyclomycin/chloramphenicol resistance-like MFS transporter
MDVARRCASFSAFMNPRALVVVLAALSMIGALSIDAYLPALPAIAGRFGLSLAVAQQSLTVYLFAFATMTLFYGTLSDSFGRRRVILGGLAIYLVGSIGAGCSMTFGWLMFFRLLQGLSAGAGNVVGRAMIADRFKGAEAERMMSYVSMVFSLAPAIAPILGGWLQAAFGWRSIFIFIALFTGGLLAICLRGLPETLAPEHRHAFHLKIVVGHYWSVACHARFILQVAATALTFSTLMIYIGSAPAFIFNILHLGATDFSWLFVPLVAGLTLGSLAAGRMSHLPNGGDRAIRQGFVILAASTVAQLLIAWFIPTRLPWATLTIATTVYGAALASPAMTLRSMAFFPHVRGLVSSLQSFSFLSLFSLSSGLIDPLLFDSAWKLAAGSAVGTVLGIALWLIAGRMRGEEAGDADISPM